MPSNSDGAFHEMAFRTQDFGNRGITMLAEFAPSSTRRELKNQLPRLVEIHDGSRMPILGTVSGYRWSLAVWSPPLVICLLAARADHLLMTIAEGLRIEQATVRQAGPTARQFVSIMPHDVPNRQLEDRMQANLKAGRHWSRGLT